MAGKIRLSRLKRDFFSFEKIFSFFKKRFTTVSKRIQKLQLKKRSKVVYRRTYNFANNRPILSFAILLAALFITIVVGSFLTRPKQEKVEAKPPKQVEVYQIGEAPRLSIQAKIEKSGIITISALSPGIVQYVNVTEGQKVAKGYNLLGLASNYQGGNAASLQKQLANLQYENVKNTYDLQKDTIKKQREVAEKTDANQDELRSITEKSLDETRSLIDLNESILTTLNENLNQLEANNANGANDTLILSTKQMISQFQGGTNQLKSALRSSEYQEDGDNPPAQLSNLQKDIALNQLNQQEKALDLSLETSLIQLKIAQINEGTFFPTSPFAGIIERVHVVPGQLVNPGTPLITLHGDQTLKAVALLPSYIAKNISKVENSEIILNGKKVSMTPSHVSTDATDGQLYAIIYQLPSQAQNAVGNNSFVTITIPIGYPDTGSTFSYIPIDTVYQSQTNSYIYIVEGDTVKSREVNLGSILGEFIEVKNGLKSGDRVVINRNIIAGDKVQVR